jgi:hypothetical protein
MAPKRLPPHDPREWVVRIAKAVLRWAERQIGKP